MTDKEIIKNYVLELSGVDHVNEEENLYEMGILNSLDILDIIAFIEETFKLSIVDNDVDMDNFNSINALEALIAKKKA